MKKTILFLSGILFCPSVFSQISIGLTVGSNIGNIKKEIDYANTIIIRPEKDEQKSLFGLIVGIPIEITLSEKFGFYTALTYNQKGYKTEQTVSFFPWHSEVEGYSKINYFEAPIQCKYFFIKKNLSVYVALGPSFGCMINARYKIEGQNVNQSGEIELINIDEKIKSKDLRDSGLNRFDLSMVIGGGISYNIWIGNVFLNVNYNHGFLNIVDEDENEIYTDVTIKNRGVNITCGYMISLSKQ